MESGIGAAWQNGGLPPWMQRPLGFDEADAADRGHHPAALDADQYAAALLAALLAADLLAERFGPLADLAAERDPRPPALIELAELAAARRSARARAAQAAALIAHRRTLLDDALEDHPTDTSGLRAA